MFTKTILSAAVVGALLSTTAYAATEASAWTDLNLRAGPGPMYQIVGVIPADGIVSVEGCLDTASWCKVSFDGIEGWASGDYLTAMVESTPVVMAISASTRPYKIATQRNGKRSSFELLSTRRGATESVSRSRSG